MKRTFFAVPVASAIRLLVADLYKNLPELRRNVRLVAVENLHLTLKFLGATAEEHIASIIAEVEKTFENSSCFEFTIHGTGVFPRMSNPKVLWLGVEDPQKHLSAINRSLENVLKTFGFPPESRIFNPHLTLGRVKDFRNQVLGIQKFLEYEFEPKINLVDRIIYFESNLTPEGAIYTPLHEFKLLTGRS